MSGGCWHGGVHGWGSSRCKDWEERQLIPSWIPIGVSTSGGSPMLTSVVLKSFKASTEAPSAGTLHLSVAWTDGISGPLVFSSASEDLSTFLFLIVLNCLFGVSKHCTLVLLIWCDPCGWFCPSGLAVDSAAVFLRVVFCWWVWSFGLVWNANAGNLQTLFFLISWVELS